MKTQKQMQTIINLLTFNGSCTLTNQGEIVSVNAGYMVVQETSEYALEALAYKRVEELVERLNKYDFVRIELTSNNDIEVHYCRFVNMLVYARFTQDSTLVIDMSDKHKYIVRA